VNGDTGGQLQHPGVSDGGRGSFFWQRRSQLSKMICPFFFVTRELEMPLRSRFIVSIEKK